jgi:signal transduction histidine kinase
MKQRAKEFGGELRMISADPGTLVEVAIPCAAHMPQEARAMA